MLRAKSLAVANWMWTAVRALVLLCASGLAAAQSPRLYQEGWYAGGELRYHEGVPIVRLSGSAEDRGRQLGLVGRQVLEGLGLYPEQLYAVLRQPEAWRKHLKLAGAMRSQFPPTYLAELQSMAEVAGVAEEFLLAVNMLPDIYRSLVGCSSLVVDASRSTSGGPLFGRNLDFFSLGSLHQYAMVIVYPAASKYAFASIGFPGFLGCLSGMNEAGLALAVHEADNPPKSTPRFDPEGTPYALVCRRVMEECASVDDAVQLFRSARHTTAVIVVLCDPRGHAIVEITPKQVAVRREADGLALCTNHFRTELAGAQVNCARYEKLLQAKALNRLGVDSVRRFLHGVNQRDLTIQSMVFEPKDLRLHLSIGKTPASAGPFIQIELKGLFAQTKDP